jgi:two-component system cell cycle sensor histidine kinase/response regulator CckA
VNTRSRVEDAAQQSEAERAPETASVAASEVVIGAAFSDADQRGGTETVLLVEDEAFVRTVTGEVLESAGYTVVIAGCATDALEAHRRCSVPVDLLLADIVLPGIGGHQLANEFGGLCPRARILLMSGYAEQLALWELSRHGGNYLAKPFSTRTLLRRVRDVLDAKPFDLGVPN